MHDKRHSRLHLPSKAVQMGMFLVQQEDDRADTESSSEAAALEAAAALTAVAALVEGLKAFLSPHLSALLHLLFSPAVLACKQANCSETAGSIRIQLAGVMPARLLLGPLFAHFDGAVQVSCSQLCHNVFSKLVPACLVIKTQLHACAHCAKP